MSDAAADFLAAWGETQTERATERADAATARAEAAERALAFERAGVDPTTPLGALFDRSYTGPVDASEVRIAWAFVREDDSDLDDAERFVYRHRLAAERRPATTTRRTPR